GTGGGLGAITNRDFGADPTGNTGGNGQINVLQRVILDGDASIGSPGLGPDVGDAVNVGRIDLRRTGTFNGANTGNLDLNGHNLTKIGGSAFTLVNCDVNGTGNIIVTGGGLGFETNTKIADDGGASKILIGDGAHFQIWNTQEFGATQITRRIEMGNGLAGSSTSFAMGGGTCTLGSNILLKGNLVVKPTFANFNNNDGTLLGSITEDATPRKITKGNNGSLTLGASNSFTGGLDITPGTNNGTVAAGTGAVILGNANALAPVNAVT